MVDFLKKNLGLFAIGFGLVAAFLLYNFFFKQPDDTLELFKKMQESHAKEMEEINKIREEERKRSEEIDKKYNERLVVLETEYKASKDALEKKKKDEAANITKKFGDKPDELAKRLSKATGFNVILPEE